MAGLSRLISLGLLLWSTTALADPYDYCRSPMWIGPCVLKPGVEIEQQGRYWIMFDEAKGRETYQSVGHVDCWRIHLTDDEIVRIRTGAMLVVRTELGDYDAIGLR